MGDHTVFPFAVLAPTPSCPLATLNAITNGTKHSKGAKNSRVLVVHRPRAQKKVSKLSVRLDFFCCTGFVVCPIARTRPPFDTYKFPPTPKIIINFTACQSGGGGKGARVCVCALECSRRITAFRWIEIFGISSVADESNAARRGAELEEDETWRATKTVSMECVLIYKGI